MGLHQNFDEDFDSAYVNSKERTYVQQRPCSRQSRIMGNLWAIYGLQKEFWTTAACSVFLRFKNGGVAGRPATPHIRLQHTLLKAGAGLCLYKN